MNKHQGDLFFITFAGPVHIDKNLKNLNFETDDYSASISSIYRSRPLGWLPKPPLATKEGATQLGIELTMPPLIGGAAISTGISIDGKLTSYIDANDSFDSLGKFSGDTIAIKILGLNSSYERGKIVENFFEYLMRHIRVETKQWWAGRREGFPSLAALVQFELSDSFKLSRSNQSSSQSFYVHSLDVKPLTNEIFESGIYNYLKNKSIDYKLSALSDVIFYHAQSNHLISIIIASNTIETSRDDIFKSLKLNPKGTDILKHLSRDIEPNTGRNLLSESSELYEFLEDLWVARSNLAHGLPFLWKSDRSTSAPPQGYTRKFEALLKWLADVESSTPCHPDKNTP